jgi:hypothetical protein
MIEKLFSGLVRIDATGGQDSAMWSLTDMWKAAGSPPGKRPVDWLRQSGTEELMQAFLSQSVNSHFASDPIRTAKGGTNPGTWAATDLAIAYAQFISAEFHLRTIQEWRSWQTAKHAAPASALTREDVVGIIRELVPVFVELIRPQAAPQLGSAPAPVTPVTSLDGVQMSTLRRAKCELVALGMKVGRWKTVAEGRKKVQGIIADATGGYGQSRGATLRLMPIQLFPVAQRAMAALRIDLERQDAILFGDNKDGTKQNLLPFMRNGLIKRRGDGEN